MVVGATSRGFVLRGRTWSGGSAAPTDDAAVVVDSSGRVAAIGPWADADSGDLPVLGAASAWVGPGVVDAHAHLAFGAPAAMLAGGVTAVRDLGAPQQEAARWRTDGVPPPLSPRVAVAGPILTAPDGYPSRSWGRDGFAAFVADEVEAVEVVRRVAHEVDVIKVALEPSGGPVPDDRTVAAIVRAAHDAGLGVTAHALTVASVRTALRAGVDELAHVPVEPLPAEVVAALAAADMLVVSTIQTFVDGDRRTGKVAIANAALLWKAGVRIAYGTDLGNAGTSPGVDPRELQRLSDCGLGEWGALRAATTVGATAQGFRGVPTELQVGVAPDVVVLSGDPIVDAEHWRRPEAVVVAGRVVAGAGAGLGRP